MNNGLDETEVDRHFVNLRNSDDRAGFSSPEEIVRAVQDARYSAKGAEGKGYRHWLIHMIKNGHYSVSGHSIDEKSDEGRKLNPLVIPSMRKSLS